MTLKTAFHKGEKGFTLLELIIALGVFGIITSGVTVSMLQVITGNARSTAAMTALKEMENTVQWLSRDSEMAQFSASSPAVSNQSFSSNPLTVQWTNTYDNTSGSVTYAIVGTQLQRAYTPVGGATVANVVAQHIDSNPSNTYWSYSGGQTGVLSFKITITVGGIRPSTQTRDFNVLPRSGQ